MALVKPRLERRSWRNETVWCFYKGRTERRYGRAAKLYRLEQVRPLQVLAENTFFHCEDRKKSGQRRWLACVARDTSIEEAG